MILGGGGPWQLTPAAPPSGCRYTGVDSRSAAAAPHVRGPHSTSWSGASAALEGQQGAEEVPAPAAP